MHAGHDLHQVIPSELKCAVAKDKTVVVRRSDALATAISKKLGSLGTIPTPATINLGIDFLWGRKHATRKASGIRAGRFAKGLRRVPRLRNLKTPLGGRKAARVGATGTFIASEYGAAVD